MHYREIHPSGLLSPYVRLFWSLEYDQTPGMAVAEKILPDGCPEIIFNMCDRFVRHDQAGTDIQPATLFAGQITRSVTVRPTGAVRLFGVRFQPSGAAAILRRPMFELTGQIVDLEHVLGRDSFAVAGRIHQASSLDERVAVFERFLVERLASMSSRDGLAGRASAMLTASRGGVSISLLSDHLGVSERRLERAFRADIGISPKTFARIVRFQAFVSAIQHGKTPDILDSSLEVGYYDQSHAIRDFREFSGVTPHDYFRSTHRLSDAFTGVCEAQS